MKTYNFINIFKYISLILKKMRSYLKKTTNKKKILYLGIKIEVWYYITTNETQGKDR